MDKREWRERAATERADLAINSGAYCSVIASFLAENVASAHRVLIFDAMPGEVDLAGLITAESDPEQRFAITRTPDEGFALTVHSYGCAMERHRFGYKQPVAVAPTVPDDSIGAVLVPGLAFARSGVRLGRGKGYYDRLLARFDSSVLLVGITGGYIVDSLPAESFDVSMTHLATETGVHPVPLA